MSRRHLSLALVVLSTFFAFVIGCKKTSEKEQISVPESTMTFKINGNQTKFTTCIAIEETGSAMHTLSISALTISDPNKALAITMASDAAIKTGFTFTQTSINDDAQGVISYLEDEESYMTFTKQDNPSAVFEVKVTEKTSTHVKGTFSGKLYSQGDDSESAAFTITEGQFNAKIQHP